MQKSSRLARLFGSPLTFVVLLLATSTLSASLIRIESARSAPTIPGYDWTHHRDVLMVVHPSGDACSSCNLSLSGWAKKGLEQGLNVLVVASDEGTEIKQLRTAHLKPESRLRIIANVDKSLIREFSKNDKIGALRLYDGQILSHQIGGSPSPTLLQPFHPTSQTKEVKS